MAWPVTFTFLIWTMAAALFLPGIILRCVPATAATGQLFLCTSRSVAMIAALTAPVVHFLIIKLAT